MSAPGDRETGDRGAFLAGLRARPTVPPVPGPHPPPAPPASVPEVRSRTLDGVDPGDPAALLPVFEAAAGRAEATVHVVGAIGGPGSVDDALAVVLGAHDVGRAVLSVEPAAQGLRPALEAAGVDVRDHTPEAAAEADLGVTAATAGIAATGSVVVDADRAGGRGAGLLPTVHLCLLRREDLVAGTGDVLRPQGGRQAGGPLPSNRVLITGPSRTGDIEQILTTGVHGPAAVHVVVT